MGSACARRVMGTALRAGDLQAPKRRGSSRRTAALRAPLQGRPFLEGQPRPSAAGETRKRSTTRLPVLLLLFGGAAALGWSRREAAPSSSLRVTAPLQTPLLLS